MRLRALAGAAATRSRDGRGDAAQPRIRYSARAFVMVFLVAVHSMLEYPLWYAYFLLPAAFAFGLCLERPMPTRRGRGSRAEVAGRVDPAPTCIASMLLMLGGTLAVYDYMRVVVIFAPPAGAGRSSSASPTAGSSVLFAHHADYAAATVAEHPGDVMGAFGRAPHYLLDARLMMAWAKALDERGETDKARYVAARLQEFRNEQTAEFFAPCPPEAPVGSGGGRALRPRPPRRHRGHAPLPFQCLAPSRPLRFEDFRSRFSALPRAGGSGPGASQSPDLPPRFSSTRTSPITMPRSTALHMS